MVGKNSQKKNTLNNYFVNSPKTTAAEVTAVAPPPPLPTPPTPPQKEVKWKWQPSQILAGQELLRIIQVGQHQFSEYGDLDKYDGWVYFWLSKEDYTTMMNLQSIAGKMEFMILNALYVGKDAKLKARFVQHIKPTASDNQLNSYVVSQMYAAKKFVCLYLQVKHKKWSHRNILNKSHIVLFFTRWNSMLWWNQFWLRAWKTTQKQRNWWIPSVLNNKRKWWANSMHCWQVSFKRQ